MTEKRTFHSDDDRLRSAVAQLDAKGDDLIRRGDALAAIAEEGLHILDPAIAALPAVPAVRVPTVDELAQTIRMVDGENRLGAGELAERILAALDTPAPAPEPCPECNDTGLRDTGGVYPWGEGIFATCDHNAPAPDNEKPITIKVSPDFKAQLEKAINSSPMLPGVRAQGDAWAESVCGPHRIKEEPAQPAVTPAPAPVAGLVHALRHIDSITVHSGGDVHGVTADIWKAAFEEVQAVARAALAAMEARNG